MYTALRSQSHSAWASMDVIDQQGPVSQKPSASTYNTDNSFFDRYRLSCDVRLPQSVSLSLLSCVVSPGRVEAGTEVVGVTVVGGATETRLPTRNVNSVDNHRTQQDKVINAQILCTLV